VAAIAVVRAMSSTLMHVKVGWSEGNNAQMM